MKTGVAVSAITHAAVLALILIGFGSARELQPETVESISVDLVPITDTSNIRAGTLNSTVVDTPTPSIVKDDKPAELAKPTGNTEEDQPTPEATKTPSPAPTTNTAPTPQPDPEPDPAPQPATPPPPVTPAERPQPAPEPQAETAPPPPVTAPEPAPQPTPPTPELATPAETPTPQEAAPLPQQVANLAEKRAAFAKAQELAKQQAAAEAKKQADEDAKKKADAEAKKQADADAKKKADAEAKKKADEAKRVADAKAKADAAKKEAAKKTQQQASLPTPDEISDLINQDTSRGGTTGQGGTPTLGKQTGQAASLSQSDLAALVSSIKACLRTPLGAKEAAAKANLTIRFNADGSVNGPPDITSMGSSAMDITWANAAVSAVKACAPYTIVAQKYDQLNEVGVLFDATQD